MYAYVCMCMYAYIFFHYSSLNPKKVKRTIESAQLTKLLKNI